MTGRNAGDEAMSNRVLHPNVLALKLEHDSTPAPRPRGTGRRLRSMAHRGMTVFQVFLLVFMLAAPAALLAAKPTSTASPSTTDASGGTGKSGDAKAKAKAPADTTKAPTDTKSSTKAPDAPKSGSSSSTKSSTKTNTSATSTTTTPTSTTGNVTPQVAGAGGSPSADLDQCANDPAPSSHLDGCDTSSSQWVNGNLGASKSVYLEGDSIPYRIRFDNLSTTGTHTETIGWDTTKSFKHAIDYLTTYTRTVSTANACLGVTSCGSPLPFAIPADPHVTGAGVTPIGGDLIMYGGQITGVSVYHLGLGNTECASATFPTSDTATYLGNSDTTTCMRISFTASQANPVLAWGGHIATRQQWGQSNSAISISGSPYHTRTIDLDGKGGNQDRSLSA